MILGSPGQVIQWLLILFWFSDSQATSYDSCWWFCDIRIPIHLPVGWLGCYIWQAWSLKLKFEACSLQLEVWSLKFVFEAWNLKLEVWSSKLEVWSWKPGGLKAARSLQTSNFRYWQWPSNNLLIASSHPPKRNFLPGNVCSGIVIILWSAA